MDISRIAVFDYDARKNILAVRYPQGLLLNNEAIIDELCRYTLAVLTGIGRRVYVLVDDTGVHFDLRMLDYFNQAFAPCLTRIIGTTRYGAVESSTRTLVGRRALQRHDTSNIYPTREMALAALHQLMTNDALRKQTTPLT